MNYAQIRSIDISNGEGIGVSLFVQGCKFYCYNCFNQETWDTNGGKPFTDKTQKLFFDLINHPYITRVSFLGGSPLIDENVITINNLICQIKDVFPDKKIWLYTGFLYEDIVNTKITSDLKDKENLLKFSRRQAVSNCDVIVDGPYIDSLKDVNLKFCGSSNQRVIDVQKSLKENKVVLWES